MSAPAIISGKAGKASYGSGPTTLAITKWTIKPGYKILEVPNTTDGMRRIAGIYDAEGSIEMHVDTSQTVETDLVGGTILALNLFTDGTKAWRIASAIISEPTFSSEVEGTYDLSFDWKLASGALATFS